MPKRRRSKAFWKNFKFKYKLTIVNENTLEEIVGLRVSKLNGLSVLLCCAGGTFPDRFPASSPSPRCATTSPDT